MPPKKFDPWDYAMLLALLVMFEELVRFGVGMYQVVHASIP